MSEWKKVEQPLTPEEPASGPDVTPVEHAPDAAVQEELAEVTQPEPERAGENTYVPSARYTAGGARRGRNKLAAPVGLIVLLLALTGVVALIVGVVNMVQGRQETAAEELRAEMEDFLEPVLVYDLPSFSSVSEAGSNSLLSDDLLLSAIWPITRREVVRQQQAQIAGESYTSPYPVDDLGRMMVPVSEVDASYAALFGADAIPQHHTIGDNEENAYAAYLYDPDAACYHVPAYFQSSQYETFLDTIRRKGDTITVRVGYVEAISIGIDDKGDPLPLTADMADHFALFTVEKTEDGYRLVSVEQEE